VKNKIASFIGGGFRWLSVKQREMLLKNIQKHRIRITMNQNSLQNFHMVKMQGNLQTAIQSKEGREEPSEEEKTGGTEGNGKC
jgi:hypothetical protein